jgi:hypothetical protein
MVLVLTTIAYLMIIMYAALADRMRGGFPDDSHWTKVGLTPPRWKHWLRKFVWHTSGVMIAIGVMEAEGLRDFGVCFLAGILFAQGDRQDMGVLGQLIIPGGNRLKGWIGQLRIGAVFAVVTAPVLYFDMALWPMLVGCFLGPILGAGMTFVYWYKTEVLDLRGQWAWMELYRGMCMATIAIALSVM